ncbi:MAG TPA: DinB family protein, partial [Cyclobacteriaceae bacterium]|nr:DinB family protein [Cyclobacteriaceae bacterium]
MLKNIVTRLLEYNLWANERLLLWLLTLDPKLLYVPVKSSFGTIDRTLQHIHSAQVFWNAILANQPVNGFNLPLRENVAAEVINDVNMTSRQLINICSEFPEQRLIEKINAPDSRQS